MRNVRFLLLATLALTLSACSVAFTHGPQSAITPVSGTCTETNTLPVLDFASGVLVGLASLGWRIDTGVSNRGVGAPPDGTPPYRGSWDIESVAKVGATLGLLVSSGIGFDRVNNCRERLRLSG